MQALLDEFASRLLRKVILAMILQSTVIVTASALLIRQ